MSMQTDLKMNHHPTVNEVFRNYGESYLQKHPEASLHERKVMRSIEICRTEALGGRVEECSSCGHKVILYNSCRNRHCPQCQSMKKEKWILERKNEVLPFTYFHIVFTLPDTLNPVVIRNKRVVYDLMFDICRRTLLSVSADEKYFGADIGFFSILHTWGQKLNLHPHLHCVVPGGGYSEKKQKWIHASNNYFVPVQVLKMRFRSLFLQGLKELYRGEKLFLQGTPFISSKDFNSMIDSLFAAEWVVYLKESFQGKESVIEYLARYTHRIAISNHRIVSFKDGIVRFKYKDYSDDNSEKIMELLAESFIQRFMVHVVPRRFVRIRYFGLLSHRNKKRAIEECRKFHDIIKEHIAIPQAWNEVYLHVTGKNISCCPACKTGRLVVVEILEPVRFRSPPERLHCDDSIFTLN
jgi:hypothetical protein